MLRQSISHKCARGCFFWGKKVKQQNKKNQKTPNRSKYLLSATII